MIDKCYAMEGNLKRIRYTQKILKEHGFSPMIQNFVKHLINVEACHLIPDISTQFSEILKRFKGEMHGTVKSAQALSDAQFKSVTDALHKANPGKVLLHVMGTPTLYKLELANGNSKAIIKLSSRIISTRIIRISNDLQV